MDFKDYYRTLGVERSASDDQIKHAYRALARKYHPDVNNAAGAEQRFVEISEAFDVLGDSDKRAAYDKYDIALQLGGQEAAQGLGDTFSFADGSIQTVPPRSDFYEMLFGRAPPEEVNSLLRLHPDYNARGEDHQTEVLIDLADSLVGATRVLKLMAPDVDGLGGVTLRERSLKLRIPKGIAEGQQIRLKGLGNPGTGAGSPGDLYLAVRFNPDPLYSPSGLDLRLDLPLSPWEAALGARLRVPTPSGAVHLNVPPGSWSGRELRIPRHGLPATPPGDLVAVVKIVLPPSDSPEARQAYQDMARRLPFDPRPDWPV